MHDVYRGEDCMKKLMKIINFEKKKMIQLTNKQHESEQSSLSCRVRDHYYYTSKYRGSRHIWNLKYSISKVIPVVFHNGSNCYDHFIIRASKRV